MNKYNVYNTGNIIPLKCIYKIFLAITE